MQTFGQARNEYANRAGLKSAHTLQAYLRAIDLFLEFIGDRKSENPLPLQKQTFTTPQEIPCAALTEKDEPLLLNYGQWLKNRKYAAATVELRLAGVQHWLEFLQQEKALPDNFSLEKAIQQFKTTAKTEEKKVVEKAVSEYPDLSRLVEYYDTQQPPKNMQVNGDRFQRWELTRLRNRALIKTLAETGGQISAILNINADAVQGNGAELVVHVIGKSDHSYPLYLKNSLPAIREYLKKRAIAQGDLSKTPVFVSHDNKYDGQRMSRIIAWRIIQRAAKAVGLPEVSPHDLRHWCAQQLIAAGMSLQEVKGRLGHRSMHTIRTYYGNKE